MNRPIQILLALLLACSAIALLGYSFYTAREQIATLEAQVLSQKAEISSLEANSVFLEQQKSSLELQSAALEGIIAEERERAKQALARESEFYDIMSSPETQAAFDRLEVSDDIEDRERIATEIKVSLTGTLARYPDGFDVGLVLDNMVKSVDTADRRSQRETLTRFLVRTSEQSEFLHTLDPLIAHVPSLAIQAPVQAIAVAEKTATQISGLLTTLGGVASGVMSLFLVIMGRGKRQIEEEMLQIDLDMKNVELAQARYDAREALDAMAEHRDKA